MIEIRDDFADPYFVAGVLSSTARHPAWCDTTDHLLYLEQEDDLTPADMFRYPAGRRGHPLDPVNHVGRVERQGGGQWELAARQEANRETPHHGYDGPPLLDLQVVEGQAFDGPRATIALTTGEARRFAAHLVALADRVDLS